MAHAAVYIVPKTMSTEIGHLIRRRGGERQMAEDEEERGGPDRWGR